MKLEFYLLAVLLLIRCSPSEASGTVEEVAESIPAGQDVIVDSTFVQKIEKAHMKGEFLDHDAIAFNIILKFRGVERLNATVTLSTDSYMGRFQLADGRSYYFIGDEVFVDPKDNSPEGLRFSAYTWSYFFLLPYKLSDHGTRFSPYEDDELNGKSYEAEKLTFKAGTGDAPDDWYILYADQDDYLLKVAAYIVTVGSSLAEAEMDPHAIVYSDYDGVDGIPISHNWTFWEWREDQGLTTQLGMASLSNVKFMDTGIDDIFEVPDYFLKL